MTDPAQSLRDKLLSIDSAEPPADYLLRLNQLIEARLSPAAKVPFAIGGLASFGFSIWFVWLAITETSLPLAARGGLIGGAVLSLVWSYVSWEIVRTGIFNRRRHNTQLLAVSSFMGIGVGVLMTVLGLDHPDLHVTVRAGFAGVMSFLTGIVFLFRQTMDQMELNNQQKLLEIQYQLSELAPR